jgi:hypothetical protein
LRSLQEIEPDFEEEAKAYAGLWSQGKKKKSFWNPFELGHRFLFRHGVTAEVFRKNVSY